MQTNVTPESIQHILENAYRTVVRSYENDVKFYRGLVELWEDSPTKGASKRAAGYRRSLRAAERKLEALKQRGRL